MAESTEIEKSHQWPQLVAVLSCLLLVLSTGTHTGWTSPAIPKLIAGDLNFDMTKDEASYLVLIYPLGYLVACPMSAFMLDKIGRKLSVLLLSIPLILAWILIIFAKAVYHLYIARLLSGVAEGGAFTMVPLYICEISEPQVRGALGICYETAFSLGFFLINCYASYMPIRTSAAISISIPLLFLLIFVWMPQSPYYLLMKGNTDDARRCLKWLRRINDVEVELTDITAAVQRQISEPGRIRDVFIIRSNLKAFFILLGLRGVQLLSGGTCFIFYSQSIFQEADGSLSHSQSAIIYTGCFTVVTFEGMFLVDRYGRRPLLLLSTSLTILCLLAEVIYFSLKNNNYNINAIRWLPITGMIFYAVVRGFGLASIPTLMMGELFSANVKAKANGILNIFVSFGLSGSAQLFFILDKHFGMHTGFLIYAICTTVAVFFIYYCVPETKGKTLEEIQLDLKLNHNDVR